MSQVNINVGGMLNKSLQVGDMGYYVNTQESGLGGDDSNNFTTGNGEIVLIGPCSVVIGTTAAFRCIGDPVTNPIPNGSFIMFSKDNAVNMASILGYYGLARFKNNSVNKAELYSAGCEMSESS
tara:strand:- start:14899 stop:15270 length:372 start_codon:yes stop_codon:yes gene_type:complete